MRRIGQDDNSDINDAIGDQQGGEQGLGFFQQGNDPSPGGILFGLEDINILKGQGEKSDFRTCQHKGDDQKEKDNNSQNGRSLRVDDQEHRRNAIVQEQFR